MRLSRLLPCVVIAGMLGVSVFGQNEPEPRFDDDIEQPREIDTDAAVPLQRFHEESPSAAESVAAEERELRKQYLQLISQKTGLMDRSALREAISRTERDIDELKATEKLQEARQLLLELVKTHPETKAARSARAMLQAKPDDAAGAPFYDQSRPMLRTPKGPIQPQEPLGPFSPSDALFPTEPEGSFAAPSPR